MNIPPVFSRNARMAMIGSSLCLLLLSSSNVIAFDEAKNTPQAENHADGDQAKSNSGTLEQRLQQLQKKVAGLEAALKKKQAGMSGVKMGDMKMGGGMKKRGMMMDKMSGEKSGSSKGMTMGKSSQQDGEASMESGSMSGMKGGMRKGKKMMGMGMMGRMKEMGEMKMPSSLPGYPGASHIYHVGSTGFFLDHSEHITLSQEQQVQLNKIKEAALLSQSTFDRQIEEAEQQLWVLTGSDKPDAVAIEARVGEIAKLSTKKRIGFIQAVGKAAGVLTDEQRKTLTGMMKTEETELN